jgi:hypothetical protein
MMRDKKIAAVLAATQLYMQQEEEAGRAALAAQPPSAGPAAEPGQWAQAGRLDLMSGRRMMQLRAFTNVR